MSLRFCTINIQRPPLTKNCEARSGPCKQQERRVVVRLRFCTINIQRPPLTNDIFTILRPDRARDPPRSPS